MAQKRFLYLTAQQLRAYSWGSGSLLADGVFEAGDEGVAEFTRYLAGSPNSLYFLVADLSVEDFFQENIPYVRGGDRRTLLARKIAQRYRDTSLALTLSLGMQEGARREERILFSSFTNTQTFQPWLEALKAGEARLVGVYSLALIAPLVARRLKLTLPRYILASLQHGGMRQSYVEDGEIRFSRLGRADPADPRAAAEACAAESDRILQYLINLRILPRETGLLDVVALAPAAHRQAYEAAWEDKPRLKLNFVDLESACRMAGLKSSPPEMLAERLFLHALALAQPADQFASDTLRRYYHLWRARLALLAGGAAVGAFSLLLAGLQLFDVQRINRETQSQARQEASITQEYNRLQASFPKTPLPRELLKAAIGTGNVILRQSVLPGPLFADISQALSAVPQIELDRLDWEISSNPRARATAGPAGAAAPAAAAVPADQPAAAPGDERSRYYEVVEITAHINAVKASDYRGLAAVVEQFLQALRQRPGLEITSTRTPLDALSEKTVTGDVAEQERESVPNFTVTFSRRIGA